MRNDLSPYAHVLNASGTGCEDGTSCAGAVPCPACKWIQEHTLEPEPELERERR